MSRVLIVAPTRALRVGLATLLAPYDVEIVGSVSGRRDIDQAFAMIDIVLFGDDATLSDDWDLADNSHLVFVVLTADVSIARRLRSLPLRAWAIIAPDAPAHELFVAIEAAMQGLIVLPQAVIQHLLPISLHQTNRTLDDPLDESLTPREQQVLQLVGHGLSNKQIARELQISEHTVKFHVSAVYGKLGAVSRADAVSRGARRGLIAV